MRLKTPEVQIGRIKVGYNNPILIQSMTNTDTSNVLATASQCMELADAGAEIVRIAINNEKAAESIPKIRKILNKKGYNNLALVGDFHFNGHTLLAKHQKCANSLDKYRINPKNVRDFEEIIKIAIKNDKPIRIGVNSGSIIVPSNKSAINAMVDSAFLTALKAEKLGIKKNKIVLSVKMSDPMDTIEAYRKLAEKMLKNKKNYALHLGVTEAGAGIEGIVKSVSALSILLNEGIGDTIRVSLTPISGRSRTEEVEVCKKTLQSLGLRYFGPTIISCPGCGRTNNKFFQQIVKKVQNYIIKNPKTPYQKIAIMGCIVNGQGEAKTANIALVIPGKTEKKIAHIYKNGKFFKTLTKSDFAKEFLKHLN